MINSVKTFCVGVALILISLDDVEDIQYFHSSTLTYEDGAKVISVSINDSLTRQEIRYGENSNAVPLNYSMDLHTETCFDNKCRLLKIVIYWNITGRYLGFELVDGEFLSKYDHEPFTEAEYEHLHALLSDPFLPLGNYSFEELVKVPDTGNHVVDGISGATSKDLLEYVVEGAAYTTHKLWNIIYGPTRDEISSLTESSLDSYLFGKILKSHDQSDKTWAVERVSLLGEFDEAANITITDILRTGEYFQCYLLLKSLSTDQIDSDKLQLELFKLIGVIDSGIETILFDRLLEANRISPIALDYSIGMIKQLNGQQLVRLLKLYAYQKIHDSRLNEELKAVVPHENSYVNRQIVQYLEDSKK